VLAATTTDNVYGHQDLSRDAGMVALMRRREDVPPAVIQKILCENPHCFYGLPH
jgi:hypothetical protein